MIGEYRFIQDGEVIDVVKNVITNNGKKQLLQYLGQMRDNWAGSMVFGVDPTAANSSNEWIGLEVYDCPVSVAKVDTSTGVITLKSQISVDADFRFSEIGIRPTSLFSAGGDLAAQKISNFSDSEGWESIDGFKYKDDTTSFAGSTFGNYIMDGGSGAYVTAGLGITKYDALDLSGYPTTSQFNLGIATSGSMNAGGGYSVRVRFYVANSSSAKFFEYELPAGTSNAYNRRQFTMAAMTANGGATAADWANIERIDILNFSGSNVLVDTLRLDRLDNSTLSDVLFSRAAVSPTKTKYAGVPLDIEYAVTFGL